MKPIDAAQCDFCDGTCIDVMGYGSLRFKVCWRPPCYVTALETILAYRDWVTKMPNLERFPEGSLGLSRRRALVSML